MDLGVIEGPTKGGYFLDSIFDPSVNQDIAHFKFIFFYFYFFENPSFDFEVDVFCKEGYLRGGVPMDGPDGGKMGLREP